MKIIKRTEKFVEKNSDRLAFLIIIAFVALYSFMSVMRHLQFETYGWDLGVFDHGIWQWSRFMIPYSSFHDLPWLADHFHLILVLVAPFYWLWSDVKMLVIVQAVITCLGAVPLYLLSKKLTKHKVFSLVLIVGYLSYYSLQWHTFSGFHALAFLPVTLGFLLYFWETKNERWYWIFLLLTLLVKEEIGFLIAALGLWEFLVDRSRWRQAVVTFALGLGYVLLMVEFIMPAIAGGAYRHAGFGFLGETPVEVLENVATNPLFLIKAFVDSPVKLKTMFVNFWPWGFLPLFSPSTLVLAFEQYASRFLDYEKTIRWTPFFAYSLPMATITAWGSIYGFTNIMRWSKKKAKKASYLAGMGLAVGILGLILFQQVVLHAPINSILKKTFYRQEGWMGDNQSVILCVPDGVSVSAQNSLVPWLSQRKQIKVFPEGLNQNYEYVILDLHHGQSENAFHFFGSEKTRFVANDLVERGFYKIVCQEGEALVLQKIVDPAGKLDYDFPIENYEK